jgi:hypothetical protein
MRITRQWHPGESKVPPDFQDTLYRIVGDVSGLRIVVTLFGRPEDTPRTDEARRQYCSCVADLMTVNPQISDVVIWNDPNDQAWWAPQFNADGSSAAPADYEALLATCWDAAHAAHANANVISAVVSEASAIPGGFILGYSPPATWISKVGAAYRASGRTKPIFDTLGYIPHARGVGRASVDEAPEFLRVRDRRLRRACRSADDRLPGHGPVPAGPERDDDLVPGAGLPDRPRHGGGGSLQRHRDRRDAPAGALAEQGHRQRDGPWSRPAAAALGRDRDRVLSAVRRRVLQLPPRRRARSQRLAVRRLLCRRHAQARLPGAAARRRPGEREVDRLRRLCTERHAAALRARARARPAAPDHGPEGDLGLLLRRGYHLADLCACEYARRLRGRRLRRPDRLGRPSASPAAAIRQRR